VPVALSSTVAAYTGKLDITSAPVAVSVTVAAYVGPAVISSLPVAVSLSSDKTTCPVRMESEAVAVSDTATLIPNVDVTTSVATASSPIPPQEL
jgi:hypothetical protein